MVRPYKALATQRQAHSPEQFMAVRVIQQESKEFQMKVVWPPQGQHKDLAPGTTDEQIFKLVKATLSDVVTRLAGERKSKLIIKDKSWRREAIRYDNASRVLREQNLTLAIEATDEKTKLKCKQHHFIPELLFKQPRKSMCFPAVEAAIQYKDHGAKLKLEEDLHFSNVKYCASGSLFVKGRATQFENGADFIHYFPHLDTRLSANTPLVPVSHWDEAVFDDISISWGRIEFADWMLVNRWQWESNTLLESELSFKVEKDMSEDWDHKRLHRASELYLELQKTGIFMAAPPIFFYDNPVSSIDISVNEQ